MAILAHTLTRYRKNGADITRQVDRPLAQATGEITRTRGGFGLVLESSSGNQVFTIEFNAADIAALERAIADTKKRSA